MPKKAAQLKSIQNSQNNFELSELNDKELIRLRNAFGTFLTGVTVVTSREESGIPRGFTANSFTSVSLNPPMLLICVDKDAESFDVFTQSDGFAVNILTENQTDISGLFASKRPDKFHAASWSESQTGYPILDGVCAWFNCERDKIIDAGDHVILTGRIQSYDYNQSIGLGYVRGGYMSLGLEQSAVHAVTEDANVVVGAIIECDGKMLFLKDDQNNGLVVPASGLDGTPGSLGKLQTSLEDMNIEIIVSSLFAVFENEDNGRQSIYYRAKVNSDNCASGFIKFEEIPWARITSPAHRIMLKRFIDESARQRYGVYFGGDRDGAVKKLSE